jgi:hypothetical protein
MDKLIKQLKRDFKKNPKKVVLLGVLGAVCLWVCVPLVFPKEEQKPVRKTVAASAAAPVAASATSTPVAPAWRWQDLDRMLVGDPRMQVIDVVALNSRSPSRFTGGSAAEFDVDAAMDELLEEIAATMEYEKQTAPSKARLDAIPLELSSTIVGPGVRSAVINGFTFREGDRIAKAGDDMIVLTVVEPRLVVVEWKGLSRELKILRPSELAARSPVGGMKGSP